MRVSVRHGFTMIELLVVLVIMGLASAIVLPALLHSRLSEQSIQSVIENAREAAAARGEVIYLRVDPTGSWHMEGGGSPLEGDSANGRVAPFVTIPVTLQIAPSGSCAFDVRSAPAAQVVALDPLTCTIKFSN